MATGVRKLIMIPEYKPLFAMSKCFGPPHGPLNPTLTPISVIGELIKQKPPYQLTVMEVVKVGKEFSDPVQLTLENYMLPYDDIVAGKKQDTPAKIETVDENTDEVVQPTVIKNTASTHTVHEVSDSVGVKVESETIDTVVNPQANPLAPDADTTDDPKPETISTVTGTSTNDEEALSTATIADPYAGMSKAERRAARRAEREAAAKANDNN